MNDQELQVNIATSQWWQNTSLAILAAGFVIAAIGYSLVIAAPSITNTATKVSFLYGAYWLFGLSSVAGVVGAIMLIYSKTRLPKIVATK